MVFLRSLVLARRSMFVARPSSSFHSSALRLGGGRSPPMPPFARSPPKWESLDENYDAVWDDGVAPELFLDFDAPNISTFEALSWLFGTVGATYILAQLVIKPLIPENPALDHEMDCKIPDYIMGETELIKK